MKCKLLRDELITHPDLKSWDDVHALGHELHSGKITPAEYEKRIRAAVPAGTVIDHPQAYMLVAMGRAEPVDEECKQRAASIMPQASKGFDFALASAVVAADRLDTAQVTGDARFDASDAEVEAMKKAREDRIAKAG
jgi:hypothetical protein